MDDGLNGIYRLEKDDVERAARILARAFGNDPLTLHAFSEEERSEENLYYFFLIPLKYCLRYGEVYAPSFDIEGVALWLTSDKYPVTFWRMLRRP